MDIDYKERADRVEDRPGIYEIFNTANGKRYVGQTDNFERRRKLHFRQLARGEHHSILLQRAWDKYGEAAFRFLPILTCAKSMLTFYEQQLLDKTKAEYNVCKIAGATIGYKHTPETKALYSLQRKGRLLSVEHRSAISNGGRGRRLTEETRKKLSAAKTGKVVSIETREKLRVINTGKTHSLATRQKISEIQRGRTRSAEARANMSAAQKGRFVSDEARKKISAAGRGRKCPPRTPEYCAIISQRKKEYWAAWRAARTAC
jgi:group I intron endonuclease